MVNYIFMLSVTRLEQYSPSWQAICNTDIDNVNNVYHMVPNSYFGAYILMLTIYSSSKWFCNILCGLEMFSLTPDAMNCSVEHQVCKPSWNYTLFARNLSSAKAVILYVYYKWDFFLNAWKMEHMTNSCSMMFFSEVVVDFLTECN